MLVELIAGCGAPEGGGVPLARDRPLSASLRLLDVQRLGPPGTAPLRASFDPTLYTAEAMHEARHPVPDDERGAALRSGEVLGRWALGRQLWDGVGLTRQRSSGEVREGLWAHPRDGTRLRIEAEIRPAGAQLSGFYGFTDFSLEHARRMGIESPVRFVLSLDGEVLHSADWPRGAGWQVFTLPLPESAERGPHRLSIEISSPRDKWAHFVFDVWAE